MQCRLRISSSHAYLYLSLRSLSQRLWPSLQSVCQPTMCNTHLNLPEEHTAISHARSAAISSRKRTSKPTADGSNSDSAPKVSHDHLVTTLSHIRTHTAKVTVTNIHSDVEVSDGPLHPTLGYCIKKEPHSDDTSNVISISDNLPPPFFPLSLKYTANWVKCQFEVWSRFKGWYWGYRKIGAGSRFCDAVTEVEMLFSEVTVFLKCFPLTTHAQCSLATFSKRLYKRLHFHIRDVSTTY